MPYIKKTIRAGAITEIEKYYTYRVKGKKTERGKRIKPTAPEMVRQNERNAHKQLRRLINANFCPGDYSLVLTFRKENRLNTPKELRAAVQKYIRRVKTAFNKINLQLKYIWVGTFGETAMHAHLIINKGLQIETLSALWEYGAVHCTPMYGKDYGQLADYLIKHTAKTFADPKRRVHGKRWCSSQNLTQPQITTEIIKADGWRQDPKAPKGYHVDKDSLYYGVSEISGYPYQYYTLKMLNPQKAFAAMEQTRILKKERRKNDSKKKTN